MASGGSVIAIKYNGGLLMAADTLLSYGSLAKWPNIPRIRTLGKSTALCMTGDYADFQDVSETLIGEVANEQLYGLEMTPQELFNYLQRTIYHRRSDFNPALCQFVMIGTHNGETLIGGIDDVGTKWTDDCVASGYGAHICMPMLRNAMKPEGLSKEEAMKVIEECLRLLFYRECRAINKFQIADASNGKVIISEPFSVSTEWSFKDFAFEKTAIIR